MVLTHALEVGKITGWTQQSRKGALMCAAQAQIV